MYGTLARWRRLLLVLLPALLLVAEALALPIKVQARGRRRAGGVTGGVPIRPGSGTGSPTITNGSTSRRAANTSAGGRFAASRNRGGNGSGNTTTVTPVERSNATVGRHEANVHRAQGGGQGTGNAKPTDVHQGIFGVPDGTGGVAGKRNGLDGTDNVVATHRLTPDGITVVRNQPGAHLSRGGAFHQAKRVAGLPSGAKPRRVFTERLRDQGSRATDARRQSRVYEFDGPNGSTIQIREHSYGHAQDMAGPHFNVDVFDRLGNKINESFLPRGADRHFYFVR